MDISNFNQLLSEPLIPAISILLILAFIFLVYKFQQYRKSQKPILQIPVIDENIKKRRPQQDQPKPLVVPSSNKTHGVTNEVKQTPVLESVELDDDPREKPLFPSQPSAPHEPEKSCDDLYKELLDPDVFEEALYKELLEGTAVEDNAQPQPSSQVITAESKSTPPTPGTKENHESESELLLTEIDKEFMELEKDLLGGNNALEENPYLQPDYIFPENNDLTSSANSLPQKDLSVKDLQLEMEETIAKLSQQVVSQKPLEKQVTPEETSPKANPVVAKIETAKTAPKEPEIPVNKTPKTQTQSKPAIPDSSKNDQYIERLKSFQSNMEQRFGSFDIANDSIRSRAASEDSLVDRIAYTASNGKSSAKDEKNSLELLESFLFTANQRNKKH